MPRQKLSKGLVFDATASLLSLLFGLFLLSGCSEKSHGDDADAKTPLNAPRVIKLSEEALKQVDLKTEAIDERTVSVPLHLTGRIEPDVNKEVDVHTRIAGRITDIAVKPGQTVQKGQLIVRLDSSEISDLESDLLESRTKLKIAEIQEERERQIYEELLRRPTALIRARAVFNETKVQLDLAESEFNRLKSLHEEKIAAAKDFIAARAKLAEVRARFEEAQANFQREEQLYQNRGMLKRDYQLAQAEAARIRNHINTLIQRLVFLGVDKKKLEAVMASGQIEGTIGILAPISGIVTFKEVAIGEVAEPSKTLFTISDMSTVMIQVDLPETDVRRVKIGDGVTVRIPSYPDEVFEGTISYMGVTVHPETRTVATRARLANRSGKLKKLMFAEIYLEGSPHKVLACPKDGIQQHGEQKIVFVETPEGFVERQIKCGMEGDKYVEILKGLSKGESVATQGSLMLKNELTFGH